MIFSQTPKKIRVMFTPFRDGLQSSFGGKVRLNDYLPAMKLAAEAGIKRINTDKTSSTTNTATKAERLI